MNIVCCLLRALFRCVSNNIVGIGLGGAHALDGGTLWMKVCIRPKKIDRQNYVELCWIMRCTELFGLCSDLGLCDIFRRFFLFLFRVKY